MWRLERNKIQQELQGTIEEHQKDLNAWKGAWGVDLAVVGQRNKKET